MFESFTELSRRVIVLAQDEARRLDHPVIATEHLLLGVLAGDSRATTVLAAASVELDRARSVVAARRQADTRRSGSGHIPFTPHAKRALELAMPL